MENNNLGLHNIQTERLILREFVKEDFTLIHIYASDPEVVRFQPWGPNSEGDTHLCKSIWSE